MDVEKMSNEELAGLLEGTEVSYNALVLDESARRLRTSMHWLPMTEDAVFEDGVVYLLCDVDGSWGVAEWKTKQRCFFQSWKEPINPKYITHYARITEPNK